MEHTRKTVIRCIEQGIKYTGRNVPKKHGRTYFLSSSYEINLLANSMQKRFVLHHTTLLINFHRHAHGENIVSSSTVNLAFRRLRPKITKIQKTQQVMNNEGKWKEARYQQVKQWFIMLNRLSEEKE